MMIQTDIKLVEFGQNLRLRVQKIKLDGEQLTPKQMQSVCNKLSVPATPYYESNNQYVLIEHKENLTKKEVKIDEWTIKLIPTDDILELWYQNKADRNAISEIYKRSLLNQIDKTGQFWKVNDSPCIFYEKKPFYQDTNVPISCVS